MYCMVGSSRMVMEWRAFGMDVGETCALLSPSKSYATSESVLRRVACTVMCRSASFPKNVPGSPGNSGCMVLLHRHVVMWPAWRLYDMRRESPSKSSIVLDRGVAHSTMPQTEHTDVAWYVTGPPKVHRCPRWPAGMPVFGSLGSSPFWAASYCSSSSSFFRLPFHDVSPGLLGFSYRLRSLPSPPSLARRRMASFRAFTSPVRRMLSFFRVAVSLSFSWMMLRHSAISLYALCRSPLSRSTCFSSAAMHASVPCNV